MPAPTRPASRRPPVALACGANGEWFVSSCFDAISGFEGRLLYASPRGAASLEVVCRETGSSERQLAAWLLQVGVEVPEIAPVRPTFRVGDVRPPGPSAFLCWQLGL